MASHLPHQRAHRGPHGRPGRAVRRCAGHGVRGSMSRWAASGMPNGRCSSWSDASLPRLRSYVMWSAVRSPWVSHTVSACWSVPPAC